MAHAILDRLAERAEVFHLEGTSAVRDRHVVALRLDKDGPVVSLTCENGTTCVWVSVTKDGPRVVLWDENGKAIWTEP